MSSQQLFTYTLNIKRGDSTKLTLPNMKYESLFLTEISVSGQNYTQTEIKLIGKEPIITINEAVFYHSQTFSLKDQLSQITSANELILSVKNLNSNKDIPFITIVMTLTYSKIEGNIIFSNSYINLNVEGLSGIMEELKKLGKYVTKIIWVSQNKLTSLEFKPLCTSVPEIYPVYKFIADSHNKIIIDLRAVDSLYIEDLKHYTMILPENIEKLGIIVYGFN